ncbi:MAG TPA: hypothetical protein VMU24_11660 [Candidatus Acidoferrales bacterium]|nr:hypothetical protein [Candidatus Acidoferrales bacterium]
MGHPSKRTLVDKILIQLIEADVETGFALVDDAKEFRATGQLGCSWRALQDAEGVVCDIERRLQELGNTESGPFQLLVTELRNEIAAAGRETC